MIKTAKWKKIRDVKMLNKSVSNTSIIAVGDSGQLCPSNGKIYYENTRFLSCAPYYDGILVLSPGTLIFENQYGVSENKVNYNVKDVGNVGSVTIIGTEEGKLIASPSQYNFAEMNVTVPGLTSITPGDTYIAINGLNQILILYDSKPSITRETYIIRDNDNDISFMSTYLVNDTFISLTSTKKLCAFKRNSMLNSSHDIYWLDLNSLFPDLDINNIYVHEDDIYLLCNAGIIAVIDNFDFNLSTENMSLNIYASKLTKSTNWMDMIYHDGVFIGVGEGALSESVFKIPDLKSGIIAHNAFNVSTVSKNRAISHFNILNNSTKDDIIPKKPYIRVERILKPNLNHDNMYFCDNMYNVNIDMKCDINNYEYSLQSFDIIADNDGMITSTPIDFNFISITAHNNIIHILFVSDAVTEDTLVKITISIILK